MGNGRIPLSLFHDSLSIVELLEIWVPDVFADSIEALRFIMHLDVFFRDELPWLVCEDWLIEFILGVQQTEFLTELGVVVR